MPRMIKVTRHSIIIGYTALDDDSFFASHNADVMTSPVPATTTALLTILVSESPTKEENTFLFKFTSGL
jgi:hypothetical protein